MKIVVLDGYTLNPGDLGWGGLEKFGDYEIFDRTDRDQIIERSQCAEILLTNKTPIHKSTLDMLPDLKYIGVLATGYNVIDLEETNKRNIVVTNTPDYGKFSVSQMVFALILELTHHVQIHSESVKNGKWSESKDFCFTDYPLIELSGKTMGIIGYGSIGRQTALIAQAFGMKVMAYSRTIKEQSEILNFRWVDLEELIKNSDVISLHCPLTDETKGIINEDRLNKMKPNVILINTARGALIVEEDLAAALEKGTIAGAGLDVMTKEPPSRDNPLFKFDNCIITPHIAWAAKEARERLMNIAIDNLQAFLSGNPINVVRR
ncbi:MAG: D-2-hydroxyacid dehydrogenase [Eubacteriaceae bacterium]|nr:D-2-hydroxyacid dehydrogenase [Eubacteriaceae bacterium]